MKKGTKEFDKIPTTKIQRASKFIATGAKIGTNYLKHYSKRLVNPETTRDELHNDNARDIYASLSELKGSALKVAQMLSMDKNLLPTAYQQRFAMAQYSAPPLSYPLVVKTFQGTFGKGPNELFDTFTRQAVNAASMGQVHQATLKGKKFAVKIQYPGVADSVKSDLAMVKPIALTMFHLNPVEYDEFIGEVELRMTEETDYNLELKRSSELSEKCRHIEGLVFPKYYPEYSSQRVLTMDWIDGKPLGEFLNDEAIVTSPPPQVVTSSPRHPVTSSSRHPVTSSSRHLVTSLGQSMWNFYHYQMHRLKAVHADPHPGNFIVTPGYKLGIIDFGCVKIIPKDFYGTYFQLMDPHLFEDKKKVEKLFYDLRFIYPDDTAKDKKFFMDLFTKLVELLGRPFRSEVFDFSQKDYFETLYSFGEELTNMKELRQSKKARGVRDAIYLNKTYFGLYNILHDLKAKIKISDWEKTL